MQPFLLAFRLLASLALLRTAAATSAENILYNDFMKLFPNVYGKIKIAMVGGSGMGKSELTNSLRGVAADHPLAAQTGYEEQTKEATCYRTLFSSEVEFCDLPGYGTESFPEPQFFEQLNLGSYDAFLLVINDRVLEVDKVMYKKLLATGRPVYIVRNKADISIDGEIRKHPKTPKIVIRLEVLEKIRNYVSTNFACEGSAVFIVSGLLENANSKFPDFERLQLVLAKNMHVMGSIRYLQSLNKFTSDALDLKESVAWQYVGLTALCTLPSATLLPPGFDFFAGTACNGKMEENIELLFGVHESQLSVYGDAMKSQLLREFSLLTLAAAVNQGVRYTVLSCLKTGTCSRYIPYVKYIPIIGTTFSVGSAAYNTYSSGEKVIKDSRGKAELMYKTLLETRAEHHV